MLKVFASIILGGLLASNAGQAQDSGKDSSKPARRTLLLYQIDTAQIAKVWLQSLQAEARRALRDGTIAHKGVVIADNQVRVNLRDPDQMGAALPRLKKLAAPLPGSLFDGWFYQSAGSDLGVTDGGNGVIVIEPTAAGLQSRIATALSQTVEVVRHRSDPDGTGEATVELQGRDRILIEVPEPAAAEVKARMGVTAKLTFQLVDSSLTAEEARAEGIPPDDLLLPDRSNPGRSVLVHKEVIVSGDDLVSVQGSYAARLDVPAVLFEFNGRGTAAFARTTRENIGKPFAIVLDNEVITAPVIRSEIPGGRGEITGGFSMEEANRLALLLRSGALPAPLSLIEELAGQQR
jgi:protein-export membrane protein SecD